MLDSLRTVTALACLLVVGPAHAQSYPSRPITLIVPFSAGGPTDTIGRIMAERLGAALGQTVIVENVTGAAGSLGVGRVARAAPDGYTLSIGHWSTHVVNGAVYSLPYHVVDDFEPISLVCQQSAAHRFEECRPGEGFAGTDRLAQG
jgi:tripartite-type tricarboxylate transporter receptor subunit TctC